MDCKTEPSLLKMFKWQHLKPKMEIALLCVAIAIAWGVLSLPIVLFHLPSEQALPGIPGEENCSVLAQTVDTCSPTETYEGQTCGQYLSAFRNCLDFGVDDIHVAPQSDQSSVEVQAMAVVGSGLQLVNPSPECEEVIRPFLCLYMFRLCDRDGRVYEPSCGLCVSIRNDICVREWTEANALLLTFGFPTLPVCEEFSDSLGQCSGPNATGSSNDTIGFSGSGSNETEVQVRNCSTIQCREGFYCTVDVTLNISICRPRCDTWEQLPHISAVLSDVAVIFSSLVCLIAGTTLLVISVIRRKQMLKFPYVFLVYLGITAMIFALFILISFVDRPGLYCSSLDLEKSVQNPTPFCTISGIVFYYAILQELLWCLLHLTVSFWKVKFPFQAKRCEERQLKYAHIAGVLIALLLPLVPVIVTVTFGGFGITTFPPIVCIGKKEAPTFYSLVVPIVIVMQIAVALLLIILWTIIHKQWDSGRLSENQSCKTDSKQKSFKIGTAEKKLLIVFCYYILLGVVALSAFTLITRNVEDLSEQVSEYFKCEAPGVDPDNPCERRFYKFSYQAFINSASYVLIALLPVVSLVYVVNVRELKRVCTRLQ